MITENEKKIVLDDYCSDITNLTATNEHDSSTSEELHYAEDRVNEENASTQNDLLKDYLSQLDKIEKRLSIKHSGAQDFELCNQKKNIKEVLKLQKEKVSTLDSEVKSLKNNLSELDDTFNKNKFYISNGYNIRYINYCNQIKEKLCLTDFKLDIVSFDLVIKNLEGEK